MRTIVSLDSLIVHETSAILSPVDSHLCCDIVAVGFGCSGDGSSCVRAPGAALSMAASYRDHPVRELWVADVACEAPSSLNPHAAVFHPTLLSDEDHETWMVCVQLAGPIADGPTPGDTTSHGEIVGIPKLPSASACPTTAITSSGRVYGPRKPLQRGNMICS